VLYLSEPLAGDLDAILARLREKTGLANWVGAVGPAVCAAGTDYFDMPAIAIMALDLADDDYRMLPSIGSPDAQAQVLGPLADWLAARQPRLALVHADPRGAEVLALVPSLAAATGAYLVGGLTSAVAPAGQIAGAPTGGGLSGTLFAERVAIATGLTQGCSPVGPLRTVTGTVGRAISELDGQPALTAFKEDIGDLLARDLRRVAGYIHAAVPVAGSDTGDYLVRNLVGIDSNHGWLAVAAELSEGDRLMFVRRDAASAIEDMTRMLDGLKRRAGAGVRGALYHSCIARGPNQFGPGAREMTLIHAALDEIPLIGFFGNGEICNDRLYTYTGVLTLFLEEAAR